MTDIRKVWSKKGKLIKIYVGSSEIRVIEGTSRYANADQPNQQFGAFVPSGGRTFECLSPAIRELIESWWAEAQQ